MGLEFNIENIERTCIYKVRGIEYNGKIKDFEIDLFPYDNAKKDHKTNKEIVLTIGNGTPTLKNWISFAELNGKEGEFIPASAPVIHAILKGLYKNRNSKNYFDLIEKARDDFKHCSLLRGSIGTLSVSLLKYKTEEANTKLMKGSSKIFRGIKQDLDELTPNPTDSVDTVIHDIGTQSRYEIKANLLSGTWRATGKSLTDVVREENKKLKELFAETCKALLNDDNINEVDSIYRWLSKYEKVQLACTTRKKPSETEVGIVSFQNGENEIWINGAGYDGQGEFKKGWFSILLVRETDVQ